MITFQRDSQNLSTRLRVLAGTRVVFVTGLLYSILRAKGYMSQKIVVTDPS